jgi:hypothetical protein
MICNNPQCFVRKDTVLSPYDLPYLLIKKITKLNSLLAQYKKKSKKIILKKNPWKEETL